MILSGNLNRILAVVAAFPTLIACDTAAPDLPKMRGGLWSQSQDVKVDAPADTLGARGKQAEALAGLNDALSDLSGMVADTHICVDDAIQEKISVIGGPDMGDNCAAKSVTSTSGGYRIGLSCTADNVTSNISIKVQGDLSSAFTSDVAIDVAADKSPVAFKGTAHHSFRYLGPCTGGMKPGDIQIKGIPKLRMEDSYARAF